MGVALRGGTPTSGAASRSNLDDSRKQLGMGVCVADRGGGDASVSSRGESGVTMLEVLVAIVLLSIAFAGIAAGLLTTMKASAGNDGSVVANSALVEVTEALKSATYIPKARPADLQPAWTGTRRLANNAGSRSYTVTIDAVSYWNPAAQAFTTAAPAKDGGAELVRVTVTSSGKSASGSVVVRNPAAKP